MGRLSAQITIGEHSGQDPLAVNDADGAGASLGLGHDQQRLGDGVIDVDDRVLLATPHDLAHREQATAEIPAGMVEGELLARKVLAVHDRDGEDITQGQHEQRRRGRREPHGAGLFAGITG